MAKKNGQDACCSPANMAGGFKVESIVTVDERGQMVLPKDLREKASIGAGEKLAVIRCGSDEEVCCICLIKSDDLGDVIKGVLGPMLGELHTQD